MGILIQQLPNSQLGLKGRTPLNFGVNPVPPNSLHNEFSTTGRPQIRWRLISGIGMRPAPSRLDIGDSRDFWKPTYKYNDHRPG